MRQMPTYSLAEPIFNRDLTSNVRTSPRRGAVYSDKHDASYSWTNYRWQRTFI